MWWNQNRMGGYGYGGMQQPQFQGGRGNAQQSQWGGGYQPQQNFGGFGGSPFGGGQQWQGGGQNWGGGYGYNQPQQQPYFGGMMGYQPQPQQGQYNQGGDMGFKSQGMNQDNRQAFSNAMGQGNQQFQSQLGQQDQGQQGFAQAFNQRQGQQPAQAGTFNSQGFAQGQAPEQGRSRQRPAADPESKIAYLQKKQEEINARDGTNYKIDQGEFDAIRNGTPRGQQMSAATQFQGQQQMGGNQTYGSMMGKFSGGGWR